MSIDPEIQKSFENSAWQLRACRALTGCANAVVNVEAIALLFIDILEQSGIEESLSIKLGGKKALSHHKFKIGIAGCANCCSEPQIRDFAVIGRLFPTISAEPCQGCGLCLRICRENALKLDKDRKIIELNANLCLGCGQCLKACRFGTLQAGQVGFEVIAGGRLGRHPRLAETVVPLVEPEEAARLLENSLVLLRQAPANERFSHVVERHGIGIISKGSQESGE